MVFDERGELRNREDGVLTARAYVVLRRCAPDILGPRTLRPFAKVEFHAIAFFQILEAFAIHGAPVKKVLLPRSVLDEPESLVNS